MPIRPLKPCNQPRCPALVDGRYCDKHKKQNNRLIKERRTDKEQQRFYDSAAWKKLRKLKLSINPLCERCEREGRTVLATIVHHKDYIREGGNLLPTLEELESVCLSCHSREHAGRKFPAVTP